MTCFVHPLPSSRRNLLLALSLIIVHLSIRAQFKDNYTILDSVTRYSFSSDIDSVLFAKLIYETNEHGQTKAYTDYIFNQETSEWSFQERREYVFDLYGRIDSVKTLQPDGTGAWKDYGLTAYSYLNSDTPYSVVRFRWDTNDNRLGTDSTCQEFDIYGGQTYIETYTWGITSEKWFPGNKRTWVRDPDGLIRETVSYFWSLDSSWNISGKQEYFYDEHRRDTLMNHYKWDEINNIWELNGISRKERDFNAEGKVTELRNYNYDLDSKIWSILSKTIYQYVSEGDTVHSEGFTWGGGEWQPTRKSSNIYDGEQRILYNESYLWIYNLQKYMGTERYIRAYNDSGQLVYSEYYSWDPEIEVWKPSFLYIYGFTPEGNKLFEKDYMWYQAVNDWEPYHAYYYYYTQVEDLDAPQISVLNDSLERGEPIALVCSQDAWIYLVPEGTGPGEDLELLQTGKCELSGMTQGEMSSSSVQYAGLYLLYAVNSDNLVSRATRVWIDIVDQIQMPAENREIQIYPTLVDQNVHIRSEQPVHSVEIFDLQGRLMGRFTGGWQEITLDLTWLDTGLYLIRCDRDSGISVLISKQ